MHPATLIPASLDPLRSMDLTIKHLPVSSALLARLPSIFQKCDETYAPTGPLDVTVKLDRLNGKPVLKARMRPDGMAGRFEGFPYPVREVRGNLDLTIAGDRPPRIDADLTAVATGQRPVTIRGWFEGDAPTPEYDITVSGDAIRLDATLIEACPSSSRASHRRTTRKAAAM